MESERPVPEWSVKDLQGLLKITREDLATQVKKDGSRKVSMMALERALDSSQCELGKVWKYHVVGANKTYYDEIIWEILTLPLRELPLPVNMHHRDYLWKFIIRWRMSINK
jgi:hypothetical protein